MERKPIEVAEVKRALERIRSSIHRTPIFTSAAINQRFGHEFFFKAESMQKVGAFKARGAINALMQAKDQEKLTHEVVCLSSGNHAQAVAWAAQRLGVRSRVLMAQNVSEIKKKATLGYGAELELFPSRRDAEDRARELAAGKNLFIHPYDNDAVMAGQGTAMLEVAEDLKREFDAVFVPCGGGGLLSGTLVSARDANPNCDVIGAEPELANDAARSLRDNKIYVHQDTPATICDGVRTLSVSEMTFSFLKQSSGVIVVTDEAVCRWMQILEHYLKLHLEPTAALPMAAAEIWAKQQKSQKRIVIILSGGNCDFATRARVYRKDYLL